MSAFNFLHTLIFFIMKTYSFPVLEIKELVSSCKFAVPLVNTLRTESLVLWLMPRFGEGEAALSRFNLAKNKTRAIVLVAVLYQLLIPARCDGLLFL